MPDRWTESGLVREIISLHTGMQDRRFAFVLGAGASVTSGIPAGGTLVRRWLGELQEREDPRWPDQALEAWATDETLGIAGFTLDRAAELYPDVFERRFRGDAEAGYAYLEEVMAGAEPSFGYTVLAQLLARTRHRVVITTNFDNLVADALSIYAETWPLVAGHESLAQFARPQMRRPLVAKIHRDLLLAPRNDRAGVQTLAEGWAMALERLFTSFTPIFIGYGGNDGSLMGFLEQLKPGAIPGRPVWCYRVDDGLPPPRVLNLVERLGGVIVGILGFDELMFRLNQGLGLGFLHDRVLEQAQRRSLSYQEALRKLQAAIQAATAPPTPAGVDKRDKRHHQGATEGELGPVSGIPAVDLPVKEVAFDRGLGALGLEPAPGSAPPPPPSLRRGAAPLSRDVLVVPATDLDVGSGLAPADGDDEKMSSFLEDLDLADLSLGALPVEREVAAAAPDDEARGEVAEEIADLMDAVDAAARGDEAPQEAALAERATARREILSLVEAPTTWWEWDLKAQQALTAGGPEAAEAVYREGMAALPEEPRMLDQAATFLAWQREKLAEAEGVLVRAAALAPDNGVIREHLQEVRTARRG